MRGTNRETERRAAREEDAGLETATRDEQDGAKERTTKTGRGEETGEPERERRGTSVTTSGNE
jgi:hypothetical protein